MKISFFYFGILLHFIATGQSTQYFLHLKNRDAYKAVVGIYPTTQSSGNYYEIKYDSRNRPVTVAYFSMNKAKSSPEFGTAKMSIIYTDTAEYRQFFDENGKKVTSNGAYMEKYIYNKQQFRIRCDFLDSSGSITKSTSNGARVYYENDPKGRIIKELQRDLNGRVVPRGAVNYYQTGFSYDDKDMMTELYNIDSTGVRAANSIGLSAMRMKWNSKGKETEWTYHDLNGNLFARPDIQFAKGIYTIDEKGRILSISYLDEHDRPANYRNAVALILNFFDQSGQLSEQRFYDKQLVLADASWVKAALIRYTKTESGVVEEKFLISHFK